MTQPSPGAPGPASTSDPTAIAGVVTWELRDEHGQVKDIGCEVSTSTRQATPPATSALMEAL